MGFYKSAHSEFDLNQTKKKKKGLNTWGSKLRSSCILSAFGSIYIGAKNVFYANFKR